jgi:Holliday junction resolvase RusA-like endonuclease
LARAVTNDPTTITIVVAGAPAPQGSKKAIINRHTGKVALIESSKAVKPWREAVRSEAAAVMRTLALEPLDGPVWAEMAFYFRRPRSHYRTGRYSHLLRPDAPIAPITPPDLSKLRRATEDALTDAGVWADDARVVGICDGKFWATNTGAVIHVHNLPAAYWVAEKLRAEAGWGG